MRRLRDFVDFGGRRPEPVEPLSEDLDSPEQFAAVRAEFELARRTAAYRRIFDMKSPLVSVCITTADRGNVLQDRALRSMREQTYANLQVIIAGDCCDDDTAQRVASLRDSRFTFINLPVRGPYPPPGRPRWLVAGTNPANAALRLVRGHLVTHIDEDDTFEPIRIEVLVKALQEAQADLVFHPFMWEYEDRSWGTLGNGVFEHGQTGTSMVLYHRWLARVPWDVYAYRQDEPGDWNRFRKLKALGTNIHYVPQCLTWHWKYPLRDPFLAKPGEEFLD